MKFLNLKGPDDVYTRNNKGLWSILSGREPTPDIYMRWTLKCRNKYPLVN